MKICYRCNQPIHSADFYESPRGCRHPFACAVAETPPVVAPVAVEAPPEPKVRTVVKTVKSAPVIIRELDRRKTAVVACVAAVLGGAAGAALTSFL